jgi:NADP-dependent 3-hydroxy acid dehydrogenase YdfG
MGALDDKVAIITGGGTGIGRATAEMFSQQGATVVLVGRRREPLDETAAAVAAAGGRATVVRADLEDGEAAAGVVSSTLVDHGRVDILVNNAGHSSRVRSIKYVGTEEFESVFKVNVEGLYRITQAAVNDMVTRGEGTVITISSIAAITPGLLGGIPYSAAKAAAYNMMRCMNTELRSEGIRACTILPGEVDTPILNNRPLPPNDEARSTMIQPEDVASAILLCATMPQRTLIEEMTMLPTRPRDVSADMRAARAIQSPDQQFTDEHR